MPTHPDILWTFPTKKYFDVEEHGHVGSHVFGVVDEVTTHGLTGVGGFIFGVHNAYKLNISDVFQSIAGNFRFVN